MKQETCDLISLVYGEFIDPETGCNFIICRVPDGARPNGSVRQIP